jgi:hypothetical protein
MDPSEARKRGDGDKMSPSSPEQSGVAGLRAGRPKDASDRRVEEQRSEKSATAANPASQRRGAKMDSAAPAAANPDVRQRGSSETWLDLLATPKASTVLTLIGVAATIATIPPTTFKYLGVLAPLAFGFVAWTAWRQKWRRFLFIGALLLCLFSVALNVRTYSRPPTAEVFYGGELMDNRMFGTPGVPLTVDPAKGFADEQLYTGEVTEFKVSCIRNGRFSSSGSSTDMKWAHIISGPYSTLWAPVPFVRAMAPGEARTLLSCSDWRWRFQYLGRSLPS